jgi:hypothetical protein
MIPILHLLRGSMAKKVANSIRLGVFILWFMAAGAPLQADGTNAASSPAPPASSDSGDFAQYLIDHQDDLAPFFAEHNSEMAREAIPLALALIGRIAVLTLIAGWAIDVFLSRCFSAFFAPVYAKLKRAFLYASGRLVLSLACMVLSGLLIFLTMGMANLAVVVMVLIGLLFLLTLGVQVWWVSYLYRMGLVPSAVFYLSVIAVHSVIAVLVSAPILGTAAPQVWLGFMNQNVTSKLQAEIGNAKHELADISHARDDMKSQVTDVQNRLTQAEAKQQDLQKEIEERKNSDAYIFSQIAKTRAKGDLVAARDQLNDFIGKFPNGNLTDAAKAALTEVNADIATREAQKKQAEADAAVAAAQARADLLSRAAKGQATLSEMRQALIGKTSAQVAELFGPPAETGSNRWGYGKQMILNPLTNQTFGLTVYYAEGVVQSVDYYYGKGSP